MGMHQDQRPNISPHINWDAITHWKTWGYKHRQQLYASFFGMQ